MRHFGLMVRDEAQIGEVREKLTKKYGIELIPPFRCDFVDPFGNRINRRSARRIDGLAPPLPRSTRRRHPQRVTLSPSNRATPSAT